MIKEVWKMYHVVDGLFSGGDNDAVLLAENDAYLMSKGREWKLEVCPSEERDSVELRITIFDEKRN